MTRTAALAAVADLAALARDGRTRALAREHALALRGVADRVDSDAQAQRERTGNAMSPERREELTAQYRGNAEATTRATIASVRQQATTADHTARTWLDAEPALDPAADAAREQRMAAAWSRYRSLLDAGQRPDALIVEAQHPDDVRALARELPAYLSAQGEDAGSANAGRGVARALSRAAGRDTATADRVLYLAARRLAVLAPGEEGERLRARHAVTDATRVITLDLEHADDALRHGAVRMAAGFAGQQARDDADARRHAVGLAPMFAQPAPAA